MDFVQQTVHGNGGQHFFGLLNGGQIDSGEAAVPDVIKAEKGDVLRDSDAIFLGGLHDAKGVGIGSGKNSGKMALLGKKLLGKLIAVLDGAGGKSVIAILRRQFQIAAGGCIAVGAQLMSGAAAAAPEIKDVPVAKSIEIFNAESGPVVVIYGHIAFRNFTQIFADEHSGNAVQVGTQGGITLRT